MVKKSYMYVVNVVYECEAGILGQELIGVTDYEKKAFEMFENYDAVKLYKEMFIEGTVIEAGTPSKNFDVDFNGAPYYEETVRMHGDEHTSGTIIKTIVKKELA